MFIFLIIFILFFSLSLYYQTLSMDTKFWNPGGGGVGGYSCFVVGTAPSEGAQVTPLQLFCIRVCPFFALWLSQSGFQDQAVRDKADSALWMIHPEALQPQFHECATHNQDRERSLRQLLIGSVGPCLGAIYIVCHYSPSEPMSAHPR